MALNLAMLKEKMEDSKQRVVEAESDLEDALGKLSDANSGEKTFMVTLLEHAFTTLRHARRHLSDLNDLVASEEAPPVERHCPACDKRIRADARTCGYCWRKLG